MAGVSFNREVKEDLKRAMAHIDESKESLKRGYSNSVVLAEETGSEKYLQSAKNMEEGCRALEATFNELTDVFGKLTQYYTRLEEAL